MGKDTFVRHLRPRKSSGVYWGTAACWLFLGGAVLAAAQESKEAPSFRLQMNVDRLLVPVVVRDGHGHTVGDLWKEDFQVFDNGKPRDISAFTIEWRGGVAQ